MRVLWPKRVAEPWWRESVRISSGRVLRASRLSFAPDTSRLSRSLRHTSRGSRQSIRTSEHSSRCASRRLSPQPRPWPHSNPAETPAAGVPIAIKDNVPVRGEVMRVGSVATPGTPSERTTRPCGGCARPARSSLERPVSRSSVSGLTAIRLSAPRTTPGIRRALQEGRPAAAVASAMVPVALGADGMGSIRIPAACCGSAMRWRLEEELCPQLVLPGQGRRAEVNGVSAARVPAVRWEWFRSRRLTCP
jgi:hypothetical protein